MKKGTDNKRQQVSRGSRVEGNGDISTAGQIDDQFRVGASQSITVIAKSELRNDGLYEAHRMPVKG